jgi:hypothetical protein
MTWNVYEVAADHEYRIGDKNVAYFRVLSTGRRREDKARATLAATAPDMLEALQSISTLSTKKDAEMALGTIQMICRAIIAKAKGETP